MKTIDIVRLCGDPEITYLQNEKNTCKAKFRVAAGRKFKREGQPEADFFDCVAFGKLAELAGKYLTKGTAIFLEGEVQIDSYEKDGMKRFYTYVAVDRFKFCGSKAENTTAAPTSEAQTQPTAPNFEELSTEDDLPF